MKNMPPDVKINMPSNLSDMCLQILYECLRYLLWCEFFRLTGDRDVA
jgi:hypothetical protein